MSENDELPAQGGALAERYPWTTPVGAGPSPETAMVSAPAAFLVESLKKAGTYKIRPEQLEILMAPLNDDDITFKWADKKKTRALAYASHPVVRRRVLRAFASEGMSLVPVEQAKIVQLDPDDDPLVVYHAWLVVDGRYIAEAYGECAYKEDNRNMTFTQALEGAKSDCWSRIGKELGIALELWEKNFTTEREKAWMESQPDYREGELRCPKCDGFGLRLSKQRAGEYYHWQKTGGCGWEGVLPNPGAAVAPGPDTKKAEPANKKPAPAGTDRGPEGAGSAEPKKKDQSRGDAPTTGTLHHLMRLLEDLSKLEEANDPAETDARPWKSTKMERWLRDHNTETDYQRAAETIGKEIAARRKLGQQTKEERDAASA